MTKDEALKMALDALEKSRPIDQSSTLPHNKHVAAITASKEVLAQQQEPVACIYKHVQSGSIELGWNDGTWLPEEWLVETYLYTSPPSKPWVNPSLKEYKDIMLENITPRTDDERDGIMGALTDMVVH